MSKKINMKMVNELVEVIAANDACLQMLHRIAIYNPASIVNACGSVTESYNKGVRNTATGSLSHVFEEIFTAYNAPALNKNEQFVKKCINQGLIKINCIKELRAFSGMGLKGAKEYVEEIAAKIQYTFPSW